MISIFINEFTNLVHVYDGTELRKTFEYQDDSFLILRGTLDRIPAWYGIRYLQHGRIWLCQEHQQGT